MYEYRAIVTKVVDGDTVRLDIDLGLGIWYRGDNYRLRGIDAPETRGETRVAGELATEHLEHLIECCKEIKAETFKDKKGKYGRYLVVLWGKDDTGPWINLNRQMIQDGFAITY